MIMQKTIFKNAQGALLGEYSELLPIPLKEGMTITIHGHPQAFTVVDWTFHYGHPDEDAGLTIILK